MPSQSAHPIRPKSAKISLPSLFALVAASLQLLAVVQTSAKQGAADKQRIENSLAPETKRLLIIIIKNIVLYGLPVCTYTLARDACQGLRQSFYLFAHQPCPLPG
jgi:hypothetical protein